MNLKYYIDNRKLYKYDERDEEVIAPEDKPRFYFGERPTLTMAFPEGVLYPGALLIVGVDTDMRHGNEGSAPMVMDVREVTDAEVAASEVSMEIVTNTQKFYQMTNGLPKNGCRQAAFGIYLRDENTGVYDTLCADMAFCYGITVEDTDPICILPEELYYTKSEINAIVLDMMAARDLAVTSANNAAASETNAASSERNAAASKTNAAASETNAAASETNAAASETNAAASAAHAAASESNAAASETNAYIWAEGTDEQVISIGGTHSARRWAEIISLSYIPKSLLSVPNGVATLNNTGKLTKDQLPEYVAKGITFNGEAVVLNAFGIANITATIPNSLAELSDDSSHRLVTDAEKYTWNSLYANIITGVRLNGQELTVSDKEVNVRAITGVMVNGEPCVIENGTAMIYVSGGGGGGGGIYNGGWDLLTDGDGKYWWGWPKEGYIDFPGGGSQRVPPTIADWFGKDETVYQSETYMYFLQPLPENQILLSGHSNPEANGIYTKDEDETLLHVTYRKGDFFIESNFNGWTLFYDDPTPGGFVISIGYLDDGDKPYGDNGCIAQWYKDDEKFYVSNCTVAEMLLDISVAEKYAYWDGRINANSATSYIPYGAIMQTMRDVLVRHPYDHALHNIAPINETNTTYLGILFGYSYKWILSRGQQTYTLFISKDSEGVPSGLPKSSGGRVYTGRVRIEIILGEQEEVALQDITLVGALTRNARNFCEIYWNGSEAFLLVLGAIPTE